MLTRRLIPLALSIAWGVVAVNAQAALTPRADETFTSLSSANFMAAIQADGTESGGARLLSNGTPAAAPSNTLSFQTRTIAELGLANAADFRLVVAPLESDNTLSITTLGVQFFSPTGTILYTATTNQTFELDTTTLSGQGFVFGLDAEQSAEAQAAAFGSNSNVVGVFGTFVNSSGGAETLFATSALGPPVTPIPEPSTYAMMLAGLLSVLAMVRRARQA